MSSCHQWRTKGSCEDRISSDMSAFVEGEEEFRSQCYILSLPLGKGMVGGVGRERGGDLKSKAVVLLEKGRLGFSKKSTFPKPEADSASYTGQY